MTDGAVLAMVIGSATFGLGLGLAGVAVLNRTRRREMDALMTRAPPEVRRRPVVAPQKVTR